MTYGSSGGGYSGYSSPLSFSGLGTSAASYGSGGSGGYIAVHPQAPSGDTTATNFDEGSGPAQYLPNTLGLQTNQENWQAGQNALDRNLQWSLANLPIQWSQQKFNTVFPYAQGILSSKPDMGQSAPAPAITQGGIWSPDQINQQVNQSKANNAQQAATQMKANQAKTAGQGYGSNSPLLAALNNATQNSMMGNNASSEQNIRWNAAQGNADELLKQQTQASSNWNNAQEQDIQRRQQSYAAQASLLGALSGYL